MLISELKKLINNVIKLNCLKAKYYYGTNGGIEVMRKYTTGTEIKTPNHTLIIHICGEIVTFMYSYRFTKWNFKNKDLVEKLLDRFINEDLINKETQPVDVPDGIEVEDINFGMDMMILDTIGEEDEIDIII